MNRCPITYEDCGDRKYSLKGLKSLSPGLTDLFDFPYSAQEQLREASARADKMSIQGVQPKLSALLKPKDRSFTVVDAGGKYIIKPPLPNYPQLPENEDLTMKMAALVGIETPLHGLVYSIDGSLTYFIKRFDRTGRKDKVPVEDFAQLSGRNRDTKYRSSMEKVVSIINQFCTFPARERARLLKLVLFNYLTGNEDSHLKNFSLIRKNAIVELSPAYDLLNTTIILDAREEIALPINGKKNKIDRMDLIDYFAKERLELTDAVIKKTISDFSESKNRLFAMIEKSFLSDALKEKYSELSAQRFGVMGL